MKSLISLLIGSLFLVSCGLPGERKEEESEDPYEETSWYYTPHYAKQKIYLDCSKRNGEDYFDIEHKYGETNGWDFLNMTTERKVVWFLNNLQHAFCMLFDSL
jgi:hypothetical protein